MIKLKNPFKNFSLSIIIKNTLKVAYQFYPIFILLFFLDLLFVILFGFIHSGITDKLSEYFYLIFLQISSNSALISEKILSGMPFLLVLFNEIKSSGYMQQISLLLFLLIIALYIIYSFIQGISFSILSTICLENKLSNTKHDLSQFNIKNIFTDRVKLIIKRRHYIFHYLNKFFIINIIWGIIYILWYSIFFLITFIEEIGANMYDLSGPNPVKIFWIFVLAVILYFTLISYTLIQFTSVLKSFFHSFKLGLKFFKIFSTYSIAVVLLLVLINYLVILLSLLNNIIAIIIGIPLTFIFVLLIKLGIFLTADYVKDRLLGN